MCAEQPALQERGDTMHPRHLDVRRFATLGQDRDSAGIAELRDVVVGGPAISVDRRARLDGLANELREAGGGSVRDLSQADAAKAPGREDLDGDRDEGPAS
jgi:hypothetical protein